MVAKLEKLLDDWDNAHDPSTGRAIDRVITLDGKQATFYNTLDAPCVTGDFVKTTRDNEVDEYGKSTYGKVLEHPHYQTKIGTINKETGQVEGQEYVDEFGQIWHPKKEE